MNAPNKYFDPGLAGNEFFKIIITHLPTQKKVEFKGWVKEFSDQYQSKWNTETVYGRMDPLATFENTQRIISLSFDVVSGARDEALANLANVNRLIEFLYPVYEQDDRSVQNTLKAAPLIGMKWANLAASPLSGKNLIGYLGGLTYNPDMSYGGFLPVGGTPPMVTSDVDEATSKQYDQYFESKRAYVPKVLTLQLQYTVLHTHLTGWAPEQGQGVLTDPGYLFGNTDIDGKFPNAFYVHKTTEEVREFDNDRLVEQETATQTEILK
tara:strand:- start:6011 stop:6811 length:801 start_codon:yes stop_codon:yes gene_type:complete